MEYLISLLLGYGVGSFPTAFLLLKKAKNIDITTVGTGNVGAMNSFDVTNSKFIGIAVLILDLFKGMLPILILKIFSINDFSFCAWSLGNSLGNILFYEERFHNRKCSCYSHDINCDSNFGSDCDQICIP